MILTRLGNKRKFAPILYSYFPKHKMRIELFFGAGGSYFYMPKPKYAILNDLDDDVTNLYLTLLNDRLLFENEIKKIPISSSLVNYWKKNEEIDPIKKAIRFILLSNFTYLGKGNTLKLGLDNVKKNIIESIDKTLIYLENVKITNYDFRQVLSKVSFDKIVLDKKDCFVYLDPIYLNTEHYYKVPKWTKHDTEDCIKLMANSGIKSAMSEFKNKDVIDIAKDYKMNIIEFKERTNIKGKCKDILITNYTQNQYSLFNESFISPNY